MRLYQISIDNGQTWSKKWLSEREAEAAAANFYRIRPYPMNEYQRQKEAARQKAIEWRHNAGDHNYSWGELADWQYYFEKLGRRYGLLQEFRENGII